jgi:hypothetical protein
VAIEGKLNSIRDTVVDHGTPAPLAPWGPRADGVAEVDRRPQGCRGPTMQQLRVPTAGDSPWGEMTQDAL